MTTDTDRLRAELRALISTPIFELSDYQSDPFVRARIGQMLVAATQRKRRLR